LRRRGKTAFAVPDIAAHAGAASDRPLITLLTLLKRSGPPDHAIDLAHGAFDGVRADQGTA
jgi:hypothetical protein